VRLRALLLIPTLLLVLACALSPLFVALRRQDPYAHQINIELGEFRLLGYRTMLPGCSPEAPCPSATAMASVADREYFVVWLLYPKLVGAARMTAGRRLLTLPLPGSS